MPTQVTIVADGTPVRTLALPSLSDSKTPGAVQTVDLTFDPVTGKDIRLVVDHVRPVVTIPGPDEYPVLLPVSIAEAGLSNVPLAAAPATVDTGCRADLVQVNGTPFPVEVRGARADARRGLDLVACDTALPLPQGSNTLTSTDGRTTGIDVDRVVLSSDTAGTPAPITPAGAPNRESGATVRVTGSTPDSYHLKVRTDGKPFWLVLGQSQNDGWEATVDGRSHRHVPSRQRVRQRLDRAPRAGGHRRRRAAVDAATRGLDRARGVRPRRRRVPRARPRARATVPSGSGRDRDLDRSLVPRAHRPTDNCADVVHRARTVARA